LTDEDWLTNGISAVSELGSEIFGIAGGVAEGTEFAAGGRNCEFGEGAI
jgi:hypothetical protein